MIENAVPDRIFTFNVSTLYVMANALSARHFQGDAGIQTTLASHAPTPFLSCAPTPARPPAPTPYNSPTSRSRSSVGSISCSRSSSNSGLSVIALSTGTMYSGTSVPDTTGYSFTRLAA